MVGMTFQILIRSESIVNKEFDRTYIIHKRIFCFITTKYMQNVKYMMIPILIILAIFVSPVLGENYVVELQNVTILFETPILGTVSISAKGGDQFVAEVDRSGENIIENSEKPNLIVKYKYY